MQRVVVRAETSGLAHRMLMTHIDNNDKFRMNWTSGVALNLPEESLLSSSVKLVCSETTTNSIAMAMQSDFLRLCLCHRHFRFLLLNGICFVIWLGFNATHSFSFRHCYHGMACQTRTNQQHQAAEATKQKNYWKLFCGYYFLHSSCSKRSVNRANINMTREFMCRAHKGDALCVCTIVTTTVCRSVESSESISFICFG